MDMTQQVMKMARAGTGAVGRVSTQGAAAIALRAFRTVGPRMPVRDSQRETMAAARRFTIRIPGVARAGTDIVGYEWGSGDRVVVLVHGWQGRAAQFATLVRDLRAEGFRVLAFDAPAHGESPAEPTYIIDWVDAVAELQRREGRLYAVVGHSFGALAAATAVDRGVRVERLVTIAAPADADALLTQFEGLMRLSPPVARAFRRRFATRYFPGEADPIGAVSAITATLGHGTRVLHVHDADDRVVPVSELDRLAHARPEASVLRTTGFGHNRVLVADEVLDTVLAFVDGASTAPASAQNSMDAAPDVWPLPPDRAAAA